MIGAAVKKPWKSRELQQELDHYRHLAVYYEKKYLKASHLYRHFRTQFAPGHFYSPYPDLKEIRRRRDRIFDRSKRDLPGIDINEAGQIGLLKKMAPYYADFPYKPERKYKNRRYSLGRHAYSYTDAIVLYLFMRHYRPKRIIEVGSGYSSALMLDVNEAFFNDSIDMTFVEPYPELLLSLTRPADMAAGRLIKEPLHKVDTDFFARLEKGDFLFIDSTHVAKAGSDVCQIFFDILPALKQGVIVHIHDVFYPFEYPEDWVKETRAWNEDYLLRAFLYNNDEFEILFFNNFMNIHHSAMMDKLLPLSARNPGGSLWLRKVR